MDKDIEPVTSPHDDALVITMEINGFNVKMALVDFEISMDVLFHDVLQALGKMKKDFKKVDFALIRFAGRTTYLLRVINLPVVLWVGWKILRIKVILIVVDTTNSYNIILGRTTVISQNIIASTPYQNMKFTKPHEAGEVRGDQPTSRCCYVNSMRHHNQKKTLSIQINKKPMFKS